MLARRAGSVTALDWRPDLLLLARREAVRRNLSNITFLEAGPNMLPFPDAAFVEPDPVDRVQAKYHAGEHRFHSYVDGARLPAANL